MAVSIDQQFIEYIIKSIVGHPDEVKIERRIDEKGVLLELSVNPEDLGRVIGKRGATAQSIRTLLRALGTKNDARYNLKIIDTGYPEGKGPSYAKASEGKPVDETVTAVAPVADLPTEASAKAGEPVASTDEPSTTAADDVDMTEDEELPETAKREEDHSDVVSRTRKELADLDDLDV